VTQKEEKEKPRKIKIGALVGISLVRVS